MCVPILHMCPHTTTYVSSYYYMLLGHSEPQVVAAAAGVVVNLAGDKDCMRLKKKKLA
jgi:hypothetical protein